MAEFSNAPVIVWFRNDLRLDDNLALKAAADSQNPIIAIYIREPKSHKTGPLGPAQDWWLHHSLAALAHSLTALGAKLILRSGEPGAILSSIINETKAGTIHWNRRHDPAGVAVDSRLKSHFKARGLTVTSFPGQLLHDPRKLVTGNGGPYRVYTPFWRALEREGEPRPPVEAPTNLPAPDHQPASEELADWALLPTKPDWATGFSELWTPGEAAALVRMDDFVDGALAGYRLGRDYPARPSTSLLSPHLAFGEISPARLWHATRNIADNTGSEDVTHFRKELAWREFCYHQLFHFPELPDKNWNDRFDAFPWRSDAELFRCWKQGKTGYPIVDAGMRQLWQHGWMHNRVRMIVASFLIKHLMIDWRSGEQWFRHTLVDADPAANAANWQWVAGSGADAAPFFRIFNPMLQSEKFDPNGDYIRQFVPELSGLDNTLIHRPFAAPPAKLDKAGITLGKTYPFPVVDHATARGRALDAYKGLRTET